jgi:hypothetical protein
MYIPSRPRHAAGRRAKAQLLAYGTHAPLADWATRAMTRAVAFTALRWPGLADAPQATYVHQVATVRMVAASQQTRRRVSGTGPDTASGWGR